MIIKYFVAYFIYVSSIINIAKLIFFLKCGNDLLNIKK